MGAKIACSVVVKLQSMSASTVSQTKSWFCFPLSQVTRRALTKIYQKEVSDCEHKLNSQRPGDNCHGWPLWPPTIPKMVTHHPHDGQIQVSGWWSTILRTSHPPSQGWSPTITRLVTYLPKDGHPPSPGWSNTSSREKMEATSQRKTI